ncbi:MAG TPA: PfkB family carbohydrate kinase [Rectinemataceae bacterium]|nr:PfkB family carbohydrate kinase [Rectinemataceae bacterium]
MPPLVVVVGGINMDIQARSAATFRPGDSNPGSVSLSAGGVGRNVAANLVSLGLRVELLTVLGDDALSGELEESCRRDGVGLSAALRRADSPASRYVCLLDSDGRLVGAVAAMDSFEFLLPQHLDGHASLLDSASVILVDANVPESSIGWLARRYGAKAARARADAGADSTAAAQAAAARPLPILGLDPVSVAKAARARAWLGDFAFAKPNRGEALVLAGEEAGASSSPAELGEKLRATGLRDLFISLGEAGIFYTGGSERGGVERGFVRPPRSLPAELKPRNVSGAGDAACAALVWGRLSGLGLQAQAACALSAALLTAAAEATTTPALCPEVLMSISQGVQHEPLP